MLFSKKSVSFLGKNTVFILFFFSFIMAFTPSSLCYANRMTVDIVISYETEQYDQVNKKIQDYIKFIDPNTSFTVSNMYGSLKNGKAILADIKKSPPDFIVSIGTGSTIFLANSINDIPIIFTMVYKMDKIDAAIDSKKNVAGIFMNPDMNGPFSILKETSPGTKTIGIIYSSEYFTNQINELDFHMEKYGYKLIKKKISTERDIPKIINKSFPEIDALYLFPEPLLMKKEMLKKIFLKAFSENIFVFGESRTFATKGALIGFDLNIKAIINHTEEIIGEYLKKKDIKTIKNRKCKDFDYFLNTRTAKLLNIQVPDDIVKNATEVFE